METKRKRRTKKDIEQTIQDTAVKIIENKGFSGLLVTEIISKAKIEPAVFYNRYNDINEFIDEFVKRYDYWFSDILKNCTYTDDRESMYRSIIKELYYSFQQNKVMQQLLRWELSTNTETSRRTAQLREFHTLPIAKEYELLFKDSPTDIVAISALILGGIYYLVLHKDLSPFSAIDINTEEGNSRITKAIDQLSDFIFESKKQQKEISIAIKMKQSNICSETIAYCTGLSLDIIEQL